jgi:hypothetical protein
MELNKCMKALNFTRADVYHAQSTSVLLTMEAEQRTES